MFKPRIDNRRSIGPNDALAEGTRVLVMGRGKGTVKSYKTVPAIPSGEINIHTIKLDSGKIWSGNYSFVYLEKIT